MPAAFVLSPGTTGRQRTTCGTRRAINGGIVLLDHAADGLPLSTVGSRFTQRSNGPVEGDPSIWVTIVTNTSSEVAVGQPYVVCVP
jgi:hypothetical protein